MAARKPKRQRAKLLVMESGRDRVAACLRRLACVAPRVENLHIIAVYADGSETFSTMTNAEKVYYLDLFCAAVVSKVLAHSAEVHS